MTTAANATGRRWRRALVALVAMAGAAVLALAAGELAVRWKVAGGFGGALRSFAGGAPASSAGATGGWFAPDPELGYVLDPARPEINERGFRGAEVAQAREPGTLRVLVLGDSVAWDEGGFVDLLRPRLDELAGSHVELVNASVPGYTAWQERVYFERELAPLAPDLVIWQHCLNDHHRLLHQLDAHGERLLTPEARRALQPAGSGPLDALLSWSWLATEWRRRSFARDLEASGAPPWEWREDLCTAWREPSWASWEEELAALARALDPESRLMVVSIPIGAQLEPRWVAGDPLRARLPQQLLRAACARRGVPVLDLLPAFEATGEPGTRGDALFQDGIHLTERGHSLAADELARFLDRERLLDTNAAPRGSREAASNDR